MHDNGRIQDENIPMTVSRRSFIKSITATGAGLPFACPGIISAKSPSEKLNIASIAVGGRGWSDVNGASQGHNLVAFCDVMTEVSKRKGGYVDPNDVDHN